MVVVAVCGPAHSPLHLLGPTVAPGDPMIVAPGDPMEPWLALEATQPRIIQPLLRDLVPELHCVMHVDASTPCYSLSEDQQGISWGSSTAGTQRETGA